MTVGVPKLIEEEWLRRKAAARFLTAQCQCPIAQQTLANLASNNNKGKGPSFTRRGWSAVYYHVDDLRIWAAKRTQRVE